MLFHSFKTIWISINKIRFLKFASDSLLEVLSDSFKTPKPYLIVFK